ncbi:MAG: hypothetical protein ACFCVD_17280 [Nodosilinea sp.]
MFQSQSPDAQASTVPFAPAPRRAAVRHLLIGSALAVDRTVADLHLKGYAEPNDWSAPLPTGRPHEVMRILTKHLLIE